MDAATTQKTIREASVEAATTQKAVYEAATTQKTIREAGRSLLRHKKNYP